MRTVLAVAWCDVRRWLRSPSALAAAIIPPVGMALLLAVLSLSVGRQPVALVVESGGAASQRMEHIVEADAEAYTLTITDRATASRRLADQSVAGVIVIPPGFDEGVAAGQATVSLTLNNVDIDFADDIRRTVARSVAQFDAPQLGIQGELLGPNHGVVLANPYRVAVDERNLRNTTVDLLHYQVIPALILLVLSVGFIGTALLCAQDVSQGTARQLLVSPASPWLLVAGRLCGGLGAVALVTLPAVALLAIFRVLTPALDHWPAVGALLLCTALASAGLGAALGAVLRGPRVVALAASTLATYLFLLGGGFTNIAFLPDWLRALSGFVPVRYAIDGLRASLFYPDLAGVARDLVVLALTAAAALTVGAASVRRSWRG